MQDDQLNKPDNLSDETWRQHLRWMHVMRKQLEDNFAAHMVRVREDAHKCDALRQHQLAAMRGKPRKPRSLFCD